MSIFLHLRAIAIGLFLFTAGVGLARDYIIYSIAQDIPMGIENEVVKKNYYMNMGTQQGVDRGAKLDVFRTVSVLDPYETKKRYNYRVKIGEIKVLHAESEVSIGVLSKIETGEDVPFFDIPNFMIGDEIKVNLN
jgi:hypothetical protein